MTVIRPFRPSDPRYCRPGIGTTTVSDAGACIVVKGPPGLGL